MSTDRSRGPGNGEDQAVGIPFDAVQPVVSVCVSVMVMSEQVSAIPARRRRPGQPVDRLGLDQYSGRRPGACSQCNQGCAKQAQAGILRCVRMVLPLGNIVQRPVVVCNTAVCAPYAGAGSATDDGDLRARASSVQIGFAGAPQVQLRIQLTSQASMLSRVFCSRTSWGCTSMLKRRAVWNSRSSN